MYISQPLALIQGGGGGGGTVLDLSITGASGVREFYWNHGLFMTIKTRQDDGG